MGYDFSEHKRILQVIAYYLKEVYNEQWALGGGTALSAFYFEHRYSEDLDIFLYADKPNIRRLIPFVYKEESKAFYGLKKAGFKEYRFPGHYLHFVFKKEEKIMNVQFFDIHPLTSQPFFKTDKWDFIFLVETIEEIIAKKIFWKTETFRPRDVFDIAVAFYQERERLFSRIFEESHLEFDLWINFLLTLEQKLEDKVFFDWYTEELERLFIAERFRKFKDLRSVRDVLKSKTASFLESKERERRIGKEKIMK